MLKWVITIFGAWLAYQVREQLPPFIIGMVIAYLLSQPVALLNQHARIGCGWAMLAIYLVAVTAIGIAAWKGLPVAAEQATSLFNHRAIIVGNLIRQLADATGWSPDVSAVTAQVMLKVQPFVTGQPQELLAVGGVLSRSRLFVLVALVSPIYFLKDASVIGAYFLRFVPEDKRDECAKVASEINRKFSRYISGQLLLVGIMAVPFAAACKVVVDHFYPPADPHHGTGRGALSAGWEQAEAMKADVQKVIGRAVQRLSDWIKSLSGT